VILGLCGSFALAPALSIAANAGGVSQVSLEPAGALGLGTGSPRARDASASPASIARVLSDLAVLTASSARSRVPVVSGQLALREYPVHPASPKAPSAPPASGGVAGAVPAAASLSQSPLAPPAPAPAPASPTPAPRAPEAGAQPSTAQAKQGVASWLDTIPAGTCANNEAPMGATIRVTSLGGQSVTCRVVSRGPFVTGRIVDLAKSTFAQLSPISQGLVGVSVTW
jgi:rare lipoprotein A